MYIGSRHGRADDPHERHVGRDRVQCRMLWTVPGKLVPTDAGAAGGPVRDGPDQLELRAGSDVSEYWCYLGATTSRFILRSVSDPLVIQFERCVHRVCVQDTRN